MSGIDELFDTALAEVAAMGQPYHGRIEPGSPNLLRFANGSAITGVQVVPNGVQSVNVFVDLLNDWSTYHVDFGMPAPDQPVEFIGTPLYFAPDAVLLGDNKHYSPFLGVAGNTIGAHRMVARVGGLRRLIEAAATVNVLAWRRPWLPTAGEARVMDVRLQLTDRGPFGDIGAPPTTDPPVVVFDATYRIEIPDGILQNYNVPYPGINVPATVVAHPRPDGGAMLAEIVVPGDPWGTAPNTRVVPCAPEIVFSVPAGQIEGAQASLFDGPGMERPPDGAVVVRQGVLYDAATPSEVTYKHRGAHGTDLTVAGNTLHVPPNTIHIIQITYKPDGTVDYQRWYEYDPWGGWLELESYPGSFRDNVLGGIGLHSQPFAARRFANNVWGLAFPWPSSNNMLPGELAVVTPTDTRWRTFRYAEYTSGGITPSWLKISWDPRARALIEGAIVI